MRLASRAWPSHFGKAAGPLSLAAEVIPATELLVGHDTHRTETHSLMWLLVADRSMRGAAGAVDFLNPPHFSAKWKFSLLIQGDDNDTDHGSRIFDFG